MPMMRSVSLSICGEVERPACLALAELRALMDAEPVADFHCREGWSRLGQRWRGVRLRTLLALAGPRVRLAMLRSAPASTPRGSPAAAGDRGDDRAGPAAGQPELTFTSA